MSLSLAHAVHPAALPTAPPPATGERPPSLSSWRSSHLIHRGGHDDWKSQENQRFGGQAGWHHRVNPPFRAKLVKLLSDKPALAVNKMG
jgi:hypothetical protein